MSALGSSGLEIDTAPSTPLESSTENAAGASWPCHLTPPSPLGWCFWRTFGVRGAGFPAHEVLRLSDSSLAAVADELAQARASTVFAWTEAESLVKGRIASILQQHGVSRPGDKPTSPFPAEMSSLRRAANLMARRQLDGALAAVLPQPLFDRLNTAHERHLALSVDYTRHYTKATEDLSSAIRDTAGHALFQEAVTWQNHSALTIALEPLHTNAPMSGARRRQREDLVASYLQRYCVKNDTIGFFGPIAWGRMLPVLAADSGFDIHPGPRLLASRNIYFEDWAIAALAEAVSSDERFGPCLTPTLLPFLRLEGGRLLFPGGASLPLSEAEWELLQACNGARTARQIAQRLLASPFSHFRNAQEILGALYKLRGEARIDFGFPLPSSDARPERALRAQFEGIVDEHLRREALDRLSRLEDARLQVAAAAGCVESLGSSLRQLDTVFESVAGAQPRRRQGEAYGGRALVYEDCLRDLQMEVSESLMLRLQESLDLVLSSARWFTGAVAQRYCAEMREIFDDLCANRSARDNQRLVDLPTFWLRAQSLFFGDGVPVRSIVDELTRRWLSVLPSLDSERRVCVPVSTVRSAALRAFAAEHTAWAQACYQSPDLLLLDPRRVSAEYDGDALAVLGEVHVGGNTLVTNGFAWQHPEPQSLLAARRSDLGPGVFVPKLSGEGSRRPIRTQWVDDPLHGMEVLFSQGARPSNPGNAVAIAALELVDLDGTLVVRHRERRWQCGLLDLFGDFIFLSIASEFRLVPRRSHTPRITVGPLVWHREHWRLPCSDLQFLSGDDDAQVFLDARQKAKEMGFPRHVFVKVPWENKPFFVDFDSIAFVRALAKQIRGAWRTGVAPETEISVSEMLPSFDHLWLRDADGRKYTSELRMVAIHRDDVRSSEQREGT